ncbi:MAG: hypothetical protein ACKOQ6_07095 [Bacteroidota bacterium]
MKNEENHLKINDLETTVKRLQEEGRMPSIEKLMNALEKAAMHIREFEKNKGASNPEGPTDDASSGKNLEKKNKRKLKK